jgi:phage/plasmid-like protein (TIGR03299 family)
MKDGIGANKLITDPLKGFRAIVRSDTDQVFQVASDRYHPVQNIDIVNMFKEFCEAGHATMETVGAIYGGSTIWALAKLNGGSDATLAGDDELKGYVMLATSHDGSLRTIGQPTDVRVVCKNTLFGAISEKSKQRFALKHSAKWDASAIKKAKEMMGISIEELQKVHEMAGKLSKITMNKQDQIDFITTLNGGEMILQKSLEDANENHIAVGKQVLAGIVLNDQIKQFQAKGVYTEEDLTKAGKAILDAITNSPGSNLISAKGTAWGALNGVTYFVDHLRSRTQDLRLQNAWFGSGDALKTAALETLVQMAGIQ